MQEREFMSKCEDASANGILIQNDVGSRVSTACSVGCFTWRWEVDPRNLKATTVLHFAMRTPSGLRREHHQSLEPASVVVLPAGKYY